MLTNYHGDVCWPHASCQCGACSEVVVLGIVSITGGCVVMVGLGVLFVALRC